MSTGITRAQFAELEELRKQNEGLLMPQQVLEFARSPNTALHSAFTWDDSVAAEKWRLDQARRVIRLAVTVVELPQQPTQVVNAYVHDPTKGAYRLVHDVIADPVAAESVLRQMRLDLDRVMHKYRRYCALMPEVAAALEAVEEARPRTQ